MATLADIPLIITSTNSTSERRINPSWTVSQLKTRLEPITGVPAQSQRLQLKVPSQPAQPLSASNEDTQEIVHWSLQPYAEIEVGLPLGSSNSVLKSSMSTGCLKYEKQELD